MPLTSRQQAVKERKTKASTSRWKDKSWLEYRRLVACKCQPERIQCPRNAHTRKSIRTLLFTATGALSNPCSQSQVTVAGTTPTARAPLGMEPHYGHTFRGARVLPSHVARECNPAFNRNGIERFTSALKLLSRPVIRLPMACH